MNVVFSHELDIFEYNFCSVFYINLCFCSILEAFQSFLHFQSFSFAVTLSKTVKQWSNFQNNILIKQYDA